MISTSDLKRGAMMELDGQIVQVLSYEHQKIGRGSAQVRLKVKNIRSGAIFDTTAQAGAKWPRIRLDQRQVQYLYSEGDLHHLRIANGDRLLLCSDGLTDMVTEPEISAVLEAHPGSQDAAAALVEQALQRGGVDNVTVIVAGYTVD